MVLGNMDVGLNTQNLCGIVIVIFLTVLNIFGLKLGAAVQNLFTIAKVSALAGLVITGIFVARNAQAIAANFGNFWRLDLPHSADRHRRWPVCGRVHDSGRGAGRIIVLRRRMEQRDVYRRRGERSQAQFAAIVGDWHRRGDTALCCVKLYLSGASAV